MIAEPRSWGKQGFPPPNAPALIQWQNIRHRLHDPDLELDIETFAAISSVIAQLERLGANLDGALLALVNILRRQTAQTESAIEDTTAEYSENHDPVQSFEIRGGDRIQVRGVPIDATAERGTA